jgi:hypothetical protein
MPIIRIGKDLRVAKMARPAGYKTTDVYRLLSNTNGEAPLGLVKWYAQWRCYSFYPGVGTLFKVGVDG